MIAVCICTFRRPDGLKRILDSIAAGAYPAENIHVFVADNDANGHEGLDFVASMKYAYPFALSCEVEAMPGISHARNRTLAMVDRSGATFDYIALTDDDTIASSQWLNDLCHTMELYGADVVVGKREARFETTPDEIILTSGFFDDETFVHTTGTVIHDGTTSNVMFRSKILEDLGQAPFDTNLTLTGGEDCDLFMRLVRKGRKIVQCASAVIYEVYPQKRLNREWILQRYFRSGSTYAYTLRKYSGGPSFAWQTVKKTAVYARNWLIFKMDPSLKNQCRLQNTRGFFHFALHGKPYEEYKS